MSPPGSVTTCVALVAASFLTGICVYYRGLDDVEPFVHRTPFVMGRFAFAANGRDKSMTLPGIAGMPLWLSEKLEDTFLFLFTLWMLVPVLKLLVDLGHPVLDLFFGRCTWFFVRIGSVWSPTGLRRLVPQGGEAMALPFSMASGGYGSVEGPINSVGDDCNGRTPVPPSAVCSTMASQETFLTWQMAHPEGTALHEGWCVWLEGTVEKPVSTQALRRSFERVLEENEALRCRFSPGADGTWMQEILPANPLFSKIYTETSAKDEEHALQVADQALHTPLQIFGGVCIRAGVVGVSSSKILLYVVQHHAVTDGKSMVLLFSQLSEFFRAETLGLQLTREPTKFRRLVAGRRAHRSTSLEQLQWWRQHLGSGEALMLDLPGDKPQCVPPSFEVVTSHFELTRELSAAIQALATQEAVTVFDIILALYSAWLSLASNSEEILVWTNCEGRAQDRALGSDSALGCFIGQLPMRLSANASGSFQELLRHSAQIKRDVLSHSDAPPDELYKLAQAVCGNFDRGHTVLTYHSDRYAEAGVAAAAAKDEFGPGIGARVGRLQKRVGTGLLQTFFAKDSCGMLRGHAKFAADRFSQAAADRLAHYFVVLAAMAILKPEAPLHSLGLCDQDAEVQLATFSGTPLPRPAPDVVQMLHRCAATAPSRAAAEDEATGQSLTYAELLSRSRGLAAHLRSIGLVADALVPLLLERSLDMIVAIHGVWAAGCGYVPVDAEVPVEMLGTIAADVAKHNRALGAERVLLTQTAVWQAKVGELCPDKALVDHILCLDATELPVVSTLNVGEFRVEGQSVAYCLYTSGSTGRPKGVMVPHRGIANYIQACDKRLEPLDQSDVILQKTPYIFDVSLYEFLSPLVAGSKLVILKHGMHKDLHYLYDAMVRCKITRTRFVPSHFELFLEVVRQRVGAGGSPARLPEESVLPDLRVIGCSGEVLRAETARRSLYLLPNIELYDLYGPTEASVDVTCLQCSGAALRPGKKTIGYALSGVQLFVTAPQPREEKSDFKLQLLPVGLRGELIIGGVQVALGYLDLFERTRESFVQVAVKGQAASEVYRTGDLVKWEADGQLVFLGRMDRQVKLHGLRIELGALEVAAARCPGVADAVAKLDTSTAAEPRLVLFVSPSAADTGEVLRCCRQALPSYMLPAEVVAVDEWPRTASGKIDQRRLVPPPCSNGGVKKDQSHDISAPGDVAALVDRINAFGVVGAMADEEIGRQGWNSFQVMRVHAQIMADTESAAAGESLSMKTDLGVIAVVGHIWVLLMTLVLVEWLVAYWEWYRCIPVTTGRWFSRDFWPLERWNSLARQLGDPLFVTLFAVQDMDDVRNGRTALLCRRAALFVVLAVLGTVVIRRLLQGPFVRYGWLDGHWAFNYDKAGGPTDCGIFMSARVFYLLVAIVMSMGQHTWVHVPGMVQWPGACLVYALLLPMALDCIPGKDGFGDGSFLAYIEGSRTFLVELSPYYFVFPMLVGGTEFPRNIVSRRVKLSGLWAYVPPLAGLALFTAVYGWLDLRVTSMSDDFHVRHIAWKDFLARHLPKHFKTGSLGRDFDLYDAAVCGLMHIGLAMMMPTTPNEISLLGTRVMGTYLTMPLFLICAGNYLGPVLLGMPPEHQVVLVPLAAAALIISCTILTGQQFLPERLLIWVEKGCTDTALSDALSWLCGGCGRRTDARTPLILKKGH